MLHATLNEAVPLQMYAANGVTTLFGRARVFNSAGTLVTTISVNHVSSGLYSGSWTPAAEGYYSVLYEFFTDAGFTTAAEYQKGSEQVWVSSIKTNLDRLLGLMHQNTVLDNLVYGVDENMVQGRLRVFDTAANAEAARTDINYSTGLRFTYTIKATYENSLLKTYTIIGDV